MLYLPQGRGEAGLSVDTRTQLACTRSFRWSFSRKPRVQICDSHPGNSSNTSRPQYALIPPLDSVTPFRHNSAPAMNESSESLHCHPLLSSWRRSSPAPPRFSTLNLLFIQRRFITPPPLQPTDGLIEEKEFPFFGRRKSRTVRERKKKIGG